MGSNLMILNHMKTVKQPERQLSSYLHMYVCMYLWASTHLHVFVYTHIKESVLRELNGNIVY